MKIINGQFPPNYQKTLEAFPAIKDAGNILFAYGAALYNPSGNPIPPSKIAHEEAHAIRQTVLGTDLWWSLYRTNKQFRLDEELIAYRAEYKRFCHIYRDANDRIRYLTDIARDLSGPIYNDIISFQDALRLIRGV